MKSEFIDDIPKEFLEEDKKPKLTFQERLRRCEENAEELGVLPYRDEEEEEIEEAELERIEAGYAALNRRLAASEKNRWGFSPAGWLSKKLISKHLNSLKTGIYSVFPIPCKGDGCPYGKMCTALKYGMEPPIGEPCVIEVNKIENLIVGYSNDFNIEMGSTTDRVLIQELIQLDLLMDRCQNMMAQDVNILQDITMGMTDTGEVYTQPVVSRYLEAWERMSKRRQSLLNEMLATRKSRKGIKEDTLNEEDILIQVTNMQKDFYEVEERPEKFKDV